MANKNPSPKTRFPKGKSGNPEGARAHNPATKALRKITLESYRDILEVIMTGNLDDLKAIIENKETPAVKVGVATAFAKAIKSGDYAVIERIAERIIGKIPDELNVNSNGKLTADINSVIDKEKLKQVLAELEEDV